MSTTRRSAGSPARSALKPRKAGGLPFYERYGALQTTPTAEEKQSERKTKDWWFRFRANSNEELYLHSPSLQSHPASPIRQKPVPHNKADVNDEENLKGGINVFRAQKRFQEELRKEIVESTRVQGDIIKAGGRRGSILAHQTRLERNAALVHASNKPTTAATLHFDIQKKNNVQGTHGTTGLDRIASRDSLDVTSSMILDAEKLHFKPTKNVKAKRGTALNRTERPSTASSASGGERGSMEMNSTDNVRFLWEENRVVNMVGPAARGNGVPRTGKEGRLLRPNTAGEARGRGGAEVSFGVEVTSLESPSASYGRGKSIGGPEAELYVPGDHRPIPADSPLVRKAVTRRTPNQIPNITPQARDTKQRASSARPRLLDNVATPKVKRGDVILPIASDRGIVDRRHSTATMIVTGTADGSGPPRIRGTRHLTGTDKTVRARETAPRVCGLDKSLATPLNSPLTGTPGLVARGSFTMLDRDFPVAHTIDDLPRDRTLASTPSKLPRRSRRSSSVRSASGAPSKSMRDSRGSESFIGEESNAVNLEDILKSKRPSTTKDIEKMRKNPPPMVGKGRIAGFRMGLNILDGSIPGHLREMDYAAKLLTPWQYTNTHPRDFTEFQDYFTDLDKLLRGLSTGSPAGDLDIHGSMRLRDSYKVRHPVKAAPSVLNPFGRTTIEGEIIGKKLRDKLNPKESLKMREMRRRHEKLPLHLRALDLSWILHAPPPADWDVWDNYDCFKEPPPIHSYWKFKNTSSFLNNLIDDYIDWDIMQRRGIVASRADKAESDGEYEYPFEDEYPQPPQDPETGLPIVETPKPAPGDDVEGELGVDEGKHEGEEDAEGATPAKDSPSKKQEPEGGVAADAEADEEEAQEEQAAQESASEISDDDDDDDGEGGVIARVMQRHADHPDPDATFTGTFAKIVNVEDQRDTWQPGRGDISSAQHDLYNELDRTEAILDATMNNAEKLVHSLADVFAEAKLPVDTDEFGSQTTQDHSMSKHQQIRELEAEVRALREAAKMRVEVVTSGMGAIDIAGMGPAGYVGMGRVKAVSGRVNKVNGCLDNITFQAVQRHHRVNDEHTCDKCGRQANATFKIQIAPQAQDSATSVYRMDVQRRLLACRCPLLRSLPGAALLRPEGSEGPLALSDLEEATALVKLEEKIAEHISKMETMFRVVGGGASRMTIEQFAKWVKDAKLADKKVLKLDELRRMFTAIALQDVVVPPPTEGTEDVEIPGITLAQFIELLIGMGVRAGSVKGAPASDGVHDKLEKFLGRVPFLAPPPSEFASFSQDYQGEAAQAVLEVHHRIISKVFRFLVSVPTREEARARYTEPRIKDLVEAIVDDCHDRHEQREIQRVREEEAAALERLGKKAHARKAAEKVVVTGPIPADLLPPDPPPPGALCNVVEDAVEVIRFAEFARFCEAAGHGVDPSEDVIVDIFLQAVGKQKVVQASRDHNNILSIIEMELSDFAEAAARYAAYIAMLVEPMEPTPLHEAMQQFCQHRIRLCLPSKDRPVPIRPDGQDVRQYGQERMRHWAGK